ncbi:hypothetical protein ACB098_07G034100 [Castanea mollissima]
MMMFFKKRRMVEVIPPKLRNLWTEWQLRVLILLSLTSQIVLVLLGKRRKYNAQPWIRFTVWSTYLIADSIALMAAGVISNDIGDVHDTGGFLDPKNELTTFWAPLLLLHLGGTDAITAYSLEDNELWKRHLVGVAVQATAILYILLTTWTSSLISLLFLVMFFVGLVKYCERVWVLYLASEKKFRDSIPDVPTSGSKLMEKCKLKAMEGYHLTRHEVIEVEMLDDSSHEEDIPYANELLTAYNLLEMAKRFFVDLILSFEDGAECRELMKSLSWPKCFKVIEIEIGLIYDLLYTKANVIYSLLGIARRIIGIIVTLIVLVLFLTLEEKHLHSKIDLTIALVLLAAALLLELYEFRELLISDQTAHWLITQKKISFLHLINSTLRPNWNTKRRCSNSIGQCSLLSFSLRKTTLLDDMLGFQTYDIPQKHMDDIKRLIFSEIEKVRDWAQVRGTENGRPGRHTLEKMACLDLAWSVELGFDQSILIWQMATEICYYVSQTNDNGELESMDETSGEGMRRNCHYLSRYMLYLLVSHPIMLPLGTGNIKFGRVYAKVREFIKEHVNTSNKHNELKFYAKVREFIKEHVNTSYKHNELKDACEGLSKVKTEIMLTDDARDKNRSDRINFVMFHACKLASALASVEKKWEIIKGVWLEMLIHAASQCRGRDHAQQLRRGGELLTHVWLLMAHFGQTYHFQISRGSTIADAILR